MDHNRFAIEVHINGRRVGPRQIVSISMIRLAGTAHSEPCAAIQGDLVFDALLAGGRNGNPVLDEFQRIDGHTASYFGDEPYAILTKHGSDRLPVGGKFEKRSVGDEVAAFAVAVDPSAPGELRADIDVLPGSAGDSVDASPVGKHVRPRAGRDMETRVQEPVPEFVGGWRIGEDIDGIHRSQRGGEWGFFGAQVGVHHISERRGERVDVDDEPALFPRLKRSHCVEWIIVGRVAANHAGE